MKLNHAQSGIRIILVSQILSILTALLSGVISMIFSYSISKSIDVLLNIDLMVSLAVLIVGLLLILSLIASVTLGMIGYIFASLDEPVFRRAMICSLAGGILTLIGSLFQVQNGTLYTVLTSAGSISEMFSVIFAVTGLIELAERCECRDIADKGGRMLRLIATAYFISAMDTLVIRLFEQTEHARIVAVVFNIIDFIVVILRLVLFIGYLSGCLKMLRGYNSAADGV